MTNVANVRAQPQQVARGSDLSSCLHSSLARPNVHMHTASSPTASELDLPFPVQRPRPWLTLGYTQLTCSMACCWYALHTSMVARTTLPCPAYRDKGSQHHSKFGQRCQLDTFRTGGNKHKAAG